MSRIQPKFKSCDGELLVNQSQLEQVALDKELYVDGGYKRGSLLSCLRASKFEFRIQILLTEIFRLGG